MAVNFLRSQQFSSVRFVYSHVIVGTYFEVTVLAWRKYATIYTPRAEGNHEIYGSGVQVSRVVIQSGTADYKAGPGRRAEMR
jgi:hypothetical protein